MPLSAQPLVQVRPGDPGAIENDLHQREGCHVPSASWQGVMSMPDVFSIHGTAGWISAIRSPSRQSPESPELSMPNTRHEPSASWTKAGPPESPKQGALPMPPTWTLRPVSTSLSVVSTHRLVPKPSFAPVAFAPKPATTTRRPGFKTSVSQPIKIGTMGRSVTGVFNLQNAQSVK